MKMICTGSLDCKNKECYHYPVHENAPPGEKTNYCYGQCFNGSVCQEINKEEEIVKIPSQAK